MGGGDAEGSLVTHNAPPLFPRGGAAESYLANRSSNAPSGSGAVWPISSSATVTAGMTRSQPVRGALISRPPSRTPLRQQPAQRHPTPRAQRLQVAIPGNHSRGWQQDADRPAPHHVLPACSRAHHVGCLEGGTSQQQACCSRKQSTHPIRVACRVLQSDASWCGQSANGLFGNFQSPPGRRPPCAARRVVPDRRQILMQNTEGGYDDDPQQQPDRRVA